MKTKIVMSAFFVLVGCVLAQPLFAYQLPAAGGEIGTSATMIGRGSIEGFSDGASGLFENPAAMTVGDAKFSASTMWCQFLSDGSMINFAASTSIFDPKYLFGVGIIKTSVSNIDTTLLNDNNEVVSSGTFNSGATTLVTGLRYTLDPKTQLGVAIKSLNSALTPTMSGTSLEFDPGVLLSYDFGDVSLVARNIFGSAVTYPNGSKESASREYVAAYRSHPLTEYGITFLADIRKKGNFLPKAIALYAPLTSDSLTLSLGYREDLVVSTIHPRMSLGVSLAIDNFSINYALEPADYFQQSGQHYVSIEFK